MRLEPDTGRRLLVAGLCVSLLVGGWAFWRTAANVTALSSSAKILSALPRPPAYSPTDTAIARLTERLKIYPGSGDTWTSLGDALMQKVRESMDVQYYGHAQAAFQRALALNRTDAQAMLGLSWVYSGRHEFEQSVDWAEKALESDPDDAEAYGLLGDAAVEMGDYDAAFRHYQRMLDLRPDLASYSRGAHLLFLTGDTRKALWLMQKAIATGSPHAENTAWCRAQLALMQWKIGALLPAEQTLDAGLRIAAGNYHLLAAMGRIKTAKKDYEAAIEYYKKAIAVAPQYDVVAALGDVYAATGRMDEAERQFALLATVHQNNRSHGVRGDIEMARFYAEHDRNLEEALRIAEAEYKTFQNVYAAETLAWAYYKNGRLEDARRLIEQALSHHTPEASILFHAGMVYAKLGQRRLAQQRLHQALSLNPTFHPVESQLAVATLADLGRR
jgi:tetratricopeptide (TPR) repeat protein